MNTPINDKLNILKQHGKIPFHMPGHKRKTILQEMPEEICSETDMVKQSDITEITGYDDLHHPKGIIRESMNQLREIYGTRESWYLVNGSTVGILAAISAVCSPKDRIVMARNCHKSVYNAVRLLRLKTAYLFPEKSSRYDFTLDVAHADVEELQKILTRERDVKAVILTSPTYEGIVSDVAAIRRMISGIDDRIVLIVDEAHGAHMHFHEVFPSSAITCGADIVIQSTHKTLPALTQTGLLHLCSDRVNPDQISDWLAVYETSSPSYILMASAESSVIFMHNRGKKVQKYVDNLHKFRMNCGQLIHIHLVEGEELPVFDYDISKLVFSVKEIKNGGRWLFEELRDNWQIELEMQSLSYVIAMTSVMDEEEDFGILFQALMAIDSELEEILKSRQSIIYKNKPDNEACKLPVRIMESYEALEKEICEIPLAESTGRTAAAYVMIYPPGIPLLVPGEKIIKEIVENIRLYLYNGYNVHGLTDGMIPVLRL